MGYVIQMFEKYYIRDCENRIEEIYDLDYATVFKTKKEAKDCINSTAFVEHSKILNYNDIIENFKKWKDNGMVCRKLPKVSSWSRKYNNEPLEEVIEFHIYNSEHEHEIKYEDYKTWPDIDKFLSCFYNIEFYFDEENEASYYTTFKIKINRKENIFNEFKNQIDRLIPYVTYKTGKYLIFSIFDHELMEYEGKYLHYNNKNDKAKIVGYRSGEIFKGSLEECFQEIRSKYYYE